MEDKYWEDRELIESLGWYHDQTTKKDGAWFYKGIWNDYMLNYKDGIVCIWDLRKPGVGNSVMIYSGVIDINRLKQID